jgi:hypothetical protein
MVLMIESQLNYLMGCLTMRARRASRVEVRADAVAEFNDEIDRSMKGTVWSSCGCSSWYLDSTGRNSALWPGWSFAFRNRTRHFEPQKCLMTGAVSRR